MGQFGPALFACKAPCQSTIQRRTEDLLLYLLPDKEGFSPKKCKQVKKNELVTRPNRKLSSDVQKNLMASGASFSTTNCMRGLEVVVVDSGLEVLFLEGLGKRATLLSSSKESRTITCIITLWPEFFRPLVPPLEDFPVKVSHWTVRLLC